MTCTLQVTQPRLESWTMNTAKPFARSACAVANSLDILGDKWSLLVVRDLLHGKHTYGHARASSPERIPTNILADRPECLETPVSSPALLISRRPAGHLRRSARTSKGSALGEVLLAFVHWGKQYIPGTVTLNQGPAGGEAAASATEHTQWVVGVIAKRTSALIAGRGIQSQRLRLIRSGFEREQLTAGSDCLWTRAAPGVSCRLLALGREDLHTCV